MSKQTIRFAAGMLFAIGVVATVRLCWPIVKPDPEGLNTKEPSIPAVAENSGNETAIQKHYSTDPSTTRFSQELRQQLYLAELAKGATLVRSSGGCYQALHDRILAQFNDDDFEI